MSTGIQAIVKIDLDGVGRLVIESKAHAAMASYLSSIIASAPSKVAISEWTPDEFKQLVAVAVDVAIIEVFLRRIVVIPDCAKEIPY